jgi:RHS repeat-associated protein
MKLLINLRRLTGVSYDSASATPAAADESYLFDLLGNRQSATLAGGDVWSYAVDEENNQYDSVTINSSNKNLSYDNRGNLTTDQDNWDYTYSSQNQLTAVKDETNSTVAVYKYDALGRRYKKTVGANSTYFMYDTQGRIIAQYTSTTTNTAPDRWFVHGNGFQPLAMLREPDNTAGLNHLAAFIETWLAGTGDGGYNSYYDFDSSGRVNMNDLDTMAGLYDFEITHPSAYYYLHDALGSTMGLLTDYPEANDWNEFYRYDAWGNIVDGSDIDNPFLWAGYYHDEETNDYYCNNRYYKPTLARWTQNDPLGTNPASFDESNPLWADRQYFDGMNVYQYCNSQPIIYLDPSGLGFWTFVDCFNDCLKDNDPIDMALEAAIAGLVAGPIPKTTVASIAKALGDKKLADGILKSLKLFPGAPKFTTLPSALSAKLRLGGRSSLRMLGKTAGKYVGPALIAYGLALAAIETHCAGTCGACEFYGIKKYDPVEMNIKETLKEYFE